MAEITTRTNMTTYRSKQVDVAQQMPTVKHTFGTGTDRIRTLKYVLTITVKINV